VIVATPGQVVVVKPSEGAGIGSWDVRAVRHALAAVLRRRPEASHATLIEHERASSGHGAGTNEAAGVGSIHDRVATKEAGLAGRLHYDAYERRSGLVHVLPAATTPDDYARAEFEELADFVDAPYRVLEAVTAGGGGYVRAARNGHVRTAAGPVPTLVEKRIEVAGGRRSPTLTLEVGIENLGATPITGLLAVEWATTMLGGGANPAAYYVLDGERVPHDSAGTRAGLTSLRSGNDYVGLDVATEMAPAADAWIAPIETISNSEAGFERVYQGSALVLTWPLDLAAGARMSVRVEQVITTSRDRAEEEGL
jgi:alpha-amylase